MFENKDILIELKENCIEKSRFNKKGIADEIEKYGYDALKEVNIGVNGKKLFIIIEDEEIFIKLITIPKSSKESINKIIKNEIIYYFNDNKNIIYTYSVFKESKDTTEVIVFCINSEKINLLEKHIYKGRLKKISLIQFCFLNYLDYLISSKNFTFIFCYNNRLYLLGCFENQILINSVINMDLNQEELFNTICVFVNNCIHVYHDVEIDTIYFANYYNAILEKKLAGYYKCVFLGNVDNSEILNYYTAKKGN